MSVFNLADATKRYLAHCRKRVRSELVCEHGRSAAKGIIQYRRLMNQARVLGERGIWIALPHSGCFDRDDSNAYIKRCVRLLKQRLAAVQAHGDGKKHKEARSQSSVARRVMVSVGRLARAAGRATRPISARPAFAVVSGDGDDDIGSGSSDDPPLHKQHSHPVHFNFPVVSSNQISNVSRRSAADLCCMAASGGDAR